MRFEIIHTSKVSGARVGRIHLLNGTVETPGFVAVATNGTIKTLDNVEAEDIGLDLIFCNTYHLLLEPGLEVIKKMGGIHKFIGRRKPIITDSGGFQIFSLSYGGVSDELKSAGKKKINNLLLKVTEEGALFRSYRDGSKTLLTPESSIDAQQIMGSDIVIPLDELPPYHVTQDQLRSSLARTHQWEERSLNRYRNNKGKGGIYGVIHGGVDDSLRKVSCNFLTSLDFDGFAIGGSLGKTKEELANVVDISKKHLPNEAPIHLLGMGDVETLHRCIEMGIDTFDSCYPTRAARHGNMLTRNGFISLDALKWRNYTDRLDNCDCFTCRNYSIPYIHHMIKAKEITYQRLISIHNLHFMVNFMKETRQMILENKL